MKIKEPQILQTAFGEYTVGALIGEGGAGRVYAGVDSAGAPVAIKLLTNASSDKRRRFKNEIGFLARNKHPNLVSVIDHGHSATAPLEGPFYVMPRYTDNLRALMRSGLPADRALTVFSQILDGVEAAHLLGAVHRDLKPENILHTEGRLGVADFGIASFTVDQLITPVETPHDRRLANFQYAAPEQRSPGHSVGVPADIYALGLILNEIFTGVVPHGTDYRRIGKGGPQEFGFLDGVVEKLLRQDPRGRPESIAHIKSLIEKYRSDAVSRQKLSRIEETVVPEGEIDDPLAFEAPKIVGAEWRGGHLHLTLDRPVNNDWAASLRAMGSYSSALGAGPEMFRFSGRTATVAIDDHQAQQVIDYFKSWMPKVTSVHRHKLEHLIKYEKAQREAQLQREREAEERLARVNQSLRI